MADPSRHPDPGTEPDYEPAPGAPGWLKPLAIALLIVALLVVAMLLVGGGGHQIPAH